MRTCADCSATSDERSNFCPNCGRPFPVGIVMSREEPVEAAGAALELRPAAGESRLLKLHDPETTIGRHPGNDVVLDDELVSRFHARIRHRVDGTYELSDSQSTNGTILNGLPITGPVPLHEGDALQVGSATFVFRARAPLTSS